MLKLNQHIRNVAKYNILDKNVFLRNVTIEELVFEM